MNPPGSNRQEDTELVVLVYPELILLWDSGERRSIVARVWVIVGDPDPASKLIDLTS